MLNSRKFMGTKMTLLIIAISIIIFTVVAILRASPVPLGQQPTYRTAPPPRSLADQYVQDQVSAIESWQVQEEQWQLRTQERVSKLQTSNALLNDRVSNLMTLLYAVVIPVFLLCLEQLFKILNWAVNKQE